MNNYHRQGNYNNKAGYSHTDKYKRGARGVLGLMCVLFIIALVGVSGLMLGNQNLAKTVTNEIADEFDMNAPFDKSELTIKTAEGWSNPTISGAPTQYFKFSDYEESGKNAGRDIDCYLYFSGNLLKAFRNGRLSMYASANVENNKASKEQSVTLYYENGSQFARGATSAQGTGHPEFRSNTVRMTPRSSDTWVKARYHMQGGKSWGVKVIGSIKSLDGEVFWEQNATGSVKANANGRVSGSSYNLTGFDASQSFTGTGNDCYYCTGWSGGDMANSGSPTMTLYGYGANGTYYANFAPQSYRIQYNANYPGANGSSGSGSTGMSYHTYGSMSNLSNNGFSLPGYKFKGWYTSTSGGTYFSQGQGVSQDFASYLPGATNNPNKIINLYAQWEPIRYNVAVNANGGSGVGYQLTNVAFNSNYDVLNPTPNLVLAQCKLYKTGYYFVGFKIVDTSNLSGYARYKYDTLSEVTLYGSTLIRPKDAYIKNLTINDGATITLVAQWVPIKFVFEARDNINNSGGSKVGVQMTADYDSALSAISSLPGVSRAGYDFVGWQSKVGVGYITVTSSTLVNKETFGVGKEVMFAFPKTGLNGYEAPTAESVELIYAKWTARNYKIGYIERNGVDPTQFTVITYNDGFGSIENQGTQVTTYTLLPGSNFALDYHNFVGLAKNDASNLSLGTVNGITTINNSQLLTVVGVRLDASASEVFAVKVLWTLNINAFKPLLKLEVQGTNLDDVSSVIFVMQPNSWEGAKLSYGAYKSLTFRATNTDSLNILTINYEISGHGQTTENAQFVTAGNKQSKGDYSYTVTYSVTSTEISEPVTVTRNCTYSIQPAVVSVSFPNMSSNQTEIFSTVDFINRFLAVINPEAIKIGYAMGAEYKISIYRDGDLSTDVKQVGTHKAVFTNLSENFVIGASTLGVGGISGNDVTSNTVTITPRIFNVTYPTSVVYDGVEHFGEMTPNYIFGEAVAEDDPLRQYIIDNSSTSVSFNSAIVTSVKNAGTYSIKYELSDKHNLRVNNNTVYNSEFVIDKCPISATIGAGVIYDKTNKTKTMSPTIRNENSGTDIVVEGGIPTMDINYDFVIKQVDVSGTETEVSSKANPRIIKDANDYRVYFTNLDGNFTLGGSENKVFNFTIAKREARFYIQNSNSERFVYEYDAVDHIGYVNGIGYIAEYAMMSGDNVTGVCDKAEMKNTGVYKALYSNPNYDLFLYTRDGVEITDTNIVGKGLSGVSVTYKIMPATVTFKNLVYSLIYNKADQLPDFTAFEMMGMAGAETWQSDFRVSYADIKGAQVSEFEAVGVYTITLTGTPNYIISNAGYADKTFIHNDITYRALTVSSNALELGNEVYTAVITLEVARMKLIVTPTEPSVNTQYGLTVEEICNQITYSITDKDGVVYENNIATVKFLIDDYKVNPNGYEIRLNRALSGILDAEMAKNYELVFASQYGELVKYYRTVSKAPITLEIDNFVVKYGDNYSLNHNYHMELKGAYEVGVKVNGQFSATGGLLLGDIFTLSTVTQTREQLGHINVDNYPIYIETGALTITNNGDAKANYDITYKQANLEIQRSTLEVRFVNAGELTSAYGAEEKAFAYEIWLNGVLSANKNLFYDTDTQAVNGIQFFRDKSHVSYRDDAGRYEITTPEQIFTATYVNKLTEKNYVITFDVNESIYYRITPITLNVILADRQVIYGSEEMRYIDSIASNISGVKLLEETIVSSWGNDPTTGALLYFTSGQMSNGARLFLELRRSSNGVAAQTKDVGIYDIEIWNMYIVYKGERGNLVINGGEKIDLTNYNLSAKSYSHYTITARTVYVLPTAGQSMQFGDAPTAEKNLRFTYQIDGMDSSAQLGSENTFAGALKRASEGTNYTVGAYTISLGDLEVLTNGERKGNYVLQIKKQDAQTFAITKGLIRVNTEAISAMYGSTPKPLTYSAQINNNFYLQTGKGVSGVDEPIYRIIGGKKTYISASGYSTTTVGDSLTFNFGRGNSELVVEAGYLIRLNTVTLNGGALGIAHGGTTVTDFSKFTEGEYKALPDIETTNYTITFSQAKDVRYTITPYEISAELLAENKNTIFVFDAVKEYDGTKDVNGIRVFPLEITFENGQKGTVNFSVTAKSGYYLDEYGSDEAVNAGQSKYYVIIYFELENKSYQCASNFIAFSDSDMSGGDVLKIIPKEISVRYQYNNGSGFLAISDLDKIFTYNSTNQASKLRIITDDFIGEESSVALNGKLLFAGKDTSEVFFAGTYVYRVDTVGMQNYKVRAQDGEINFVVDKAKVVITPNGGQSNIYGEAQKSLTIQKPILQGKDSIEYVLALDSNPEDKVISVGKYVYKFSSYRIFVPEFESASTGIDVSDCYEVAVNNEITYEVTLRGVSFNILNLAYMSSYYGEPIANMSLLGVELSKGSLVTAISSPHYIKEKIFTVDGSNNAGTYNIIGRIVIYEGEKDVSDNYKVTFSNQNSAKYTIKRLPIIITPKTTLGAEQIAKSSYYKPYVDIDYTITTIKGVNVVFDKVKKTLANGDKYELVLCPNGAENGEVLDVGNYMISKRVFTINSVDYSKFTNDQLSEAVPNYSINYDNKQGTYQVTPAYLNFIVQAKTVTYGDIDVLGNDFSDLLAYVSLDGNIMNPNFERTFTLYGTDTVDISGMLIRQQGKNVGEYIISLRQVDGGYVQPILSSSKNYKLLSPETSTAIYTVQKKTVNITGEDFTKVGDYDYERVYDGTDIANGIALGREIDGSYGEKIIFDNIRGLFNTKDVLSANSITDLELVYGDELNNYRIVLADGIALRGIITVKEITVAHSLPFGSDGKYVHGYNGKDILTEAGEGYLGVAITDGLIASDTGRLGVGYTVVEGYKSGDNVIQNVLHGGNYVVDVTLSGEEKDNYTVKEDLIRRRVEITSAQVTLTAEPITINYGDFIEDFIYEYVEIGGILVQRVKAYKIIGLVKGDDINDYLDIDMKPAVRDPITGELKPIKLTREDLQDVGTYDLIFTYTPKAGAYPNYIVDSSAGNSVYIVKAKAVSVKIGLVHKTYGVKDSDVEWYKYLTVEGVASAENEAIRRYISINSIYRESTSENVSAQPYKLRGRNLPDDVEYTYNGVTLKLKNYLVTYNYNEGAALIIDKADLVIGMNNNVVNAQYGDSILIDTLFYSGGVLNVVSGIADRDKIIVNGNVVGYKITDLRLPTIGLLSAEYRTVGRHNVPMTTASSANYNISVTFDNVEVVVERKTLTFHPSSKENAYEIEHTADINSLSVLGENLYTFDGLATAYGQRVILTKDYNAVADVYKNNEKYLILLYVDNLSELMSVTGKNKTYILSVTGIPEAEQNNASKPYANYTIDTSEFTVNNFVWIVKAKPSVKTTVNGIYSYVFDANGKDITLDPNNAPTVFKNDTYTETLPDMISSVKYYTEYTPSDGMTAEYFGGYLGDNGYPINSGLYYVVITTKDNADYDSIRIINKVVISRSSLATHTSVAGKVKYGEKNTVTITVNVNGLPNDGNYVNQEFMFDVNIALRGAGDYTAVYKFEGSDNYAPCDMVCNYTIDKAVLAVDFSANGEFVYDGTGKSLNYKLTGIVGDDEVNTTLSYVGLQGNPIKAGNYKAQVTSRNPNYEIAEGEHSFRINKAKLNVSAENIQVKKGDKLEIIPAYTGYVNGEDITVVKIAPEAVNKTTNTLATTVSAGVFHLTFNGGSADNYEFVYGEFVLTVLQTELTSDKSNVKVDGEFNNDVVFDIESKYYANGAQYASDKEKEQVEKFADELKSADGKAYQGYSRFKVTISADNILSDTITLNFNLKTKELVDNGASTGAQAAQSIRTAIMAQKAKEQSTGVFSIKTGGFNENKVYYKLVRVMPDGTFKIVNDVKFDGDYASITVDKLNASGEYLIYSYTEDAQSYAVLIMIGACLGALLLGLFIFMAVKKR